MARSLENNSKIEKSQLKECVICGGPAIYSYFGAIACQPCKIFFKRNAERERINSKQVLQDVLKCDLDGHCEINRNSRRVCSYCRLMKCFANGMQIEMIRSSQGTRKRKLPPPTTPPTNLIQPEEFPTLNLLQSDQSTLTLDQWNCLSNLFHCYDEHSELSIGERYMREQEILPYKLRYKSQSIMNLVQILNYGAQSLYINNEDFVSLSSDDRSILLHNTLKQTAALSSNFIHYKIGLMEHSTYFETIGILSHESLISCAKLVAQRINFDMEIMKLFLVILCFSTTNYTIYSNNPPINLSNMKQILTIQNKYIELTWKYLLYRYNYQRTVIVFSDFIRCLFAIHAAIVKVDDVKWYINAIDSVVQQTEQTLTINH